MHIYFLLAQAISSPHQEPGCLHKSAHLLFLQKHPCRLAASFLPYPFSPFYSIPQTLCIIEITGQLPDPFLRSQGYFVASAAQIAVNKLLQRAIKITFASALHGRSSFLANMSKRSICQHIHPKTFRLFN